MPGRRRHQERGAKRTRIGFASGLRLEVIWDAMKLTDITPAIALTPLDGRYHKQTAPLVEYLSEPALTRERMRSDMRAALGLPPLPEE